MFAALFSHALYRIRCVVIIVNLGEGIEEAGVKELKMNDSDVSKQIQQMVRFIRQEAQEKANEITLSAEEECNIEKLQIVEAEKKKIRQEYERKTKQVEVRKKMYVSPSPIIYSNFLHLLLINLLNAMAVSIQRSLTHRASKCFRLKTTR